MKKICLILAVIMSFVSVCDFIAIGGNDSSTMSLFYSFTIITSPSAVSMELSEAKVGIIISDKNKALAFIPAKQEYADLVKSNERNIK